MIIFELNARVYGKPFNKITNKELKRISSLGFDWLWIMGIWRESEGGRNIARQQAPDFEASPYAIMDYEVNPALGGESAYRDLVERAHAAGLRVMADFVPNHMAVDSPLIDSHPEFFIQSHPEWRPERQEDYFNHRVGRLAHGRDPYFAGWTDTAQLDYLHPGLRAHQIDVLKRMATMVDGLRCDMAMLVLREQIKNQWYTYVDWDGFNYHMPEEFWSEAIRAVRSIRSDFIFMAEVYWDKEPYLQQLGFDLTYNKKLYDLLEHNVSPEEIAHYLGSTSNDYLAHSVHFLENHDEERAAVRFGSRQRPAAALSFAIPGVPFVHQGQMEGFKEKLPVQRIRPLTVEKEDEDLQRFYKQLLACVKDPLFRNNDMLPLGVQDGSVLLCRRHEGRLALVCVNTTGSQNDTSPAVELPLDRLGLEHGSKIRTVDLFSGKTVKNANVESDNYRLSLGAVANWKENGFFFLELVRI
jgi:glycosidase